NRPQSSISLSSRTFLAIEDGRKDENRGPPGPVNNGPEALHSVVGGGGGQGEEDMAQNIQDVMTPNPFLVSTETPVAEAARMMRQVDVGSLIVLEEGAVCGIVTDRDITIRAVAEERDGPTTPVGEVCSREPLTLSLGDSIEQAIEVMRTHSVRRLPV